MVDRWVRLERYARWKQQRFAFERLPEDLLAHVARFLDADDVCRLLETLYGDGTDKLRRLCPCAIRKIPQEVCCMHIAQRVHRHLSELLYCAGAFALHKEAPSRRSRIVAMADWSPFASRGHYIIPAPLATYRWISLPPFTNININSTQIHNVIAKHIHERLPAFTLSLYRILESTTDVFLSVPMSVTTELLYPPSLFQ